MAIHITDWFASALVIRSVSGETLLVQRCVPLLKKKKERKQTHTHTHPSCCSRGVPVEDACRAAEEATTALGAQAFLAGSVRALSDALRVQVCDELCTHGWLGARTDPIPSPTAQYRLLGAVYALLVAPPSTSALLADELLQGAVQVLLAHTKTPAQGCEAQGVALV